MPPQRCVRPLANPDGGIFWIWEMGRERGRGRGRYNHHHALHAGRTLLMGTHGGNVNMGDAAPSHRWISDSRERSSEARDESLGKSRLSWILAGFWVAALSLKISHLDRDGGEGGSSGRARKKGYITRRLSWVMSLGLMGSRHGRVIDCKPVCNPSPPLSRCCRRK
jgi:hypothetical protein